ncbi:GNAT family N-acetyltransferase [Streptomyces sp. SPB074]|uniref:GNAT family N-acetyltransferase n=1 Tax=Streptomyces sp. (strain SPB074) TaxID=465543 RepID=UPI00017F13E9|nr:GNAT family N-acetyltransferase [Streptomyces sp. SPB074]
MTTTLRPTEPLQHDPDGACHRAYEIRVNSRPVGGLVLSAHTEYGLGSIVGLRVAEPDRGRGRAAVAVLAAEEVLRGWGCRRSEGVVPSGSEAGLRLAASLGYTEDARLLRKALRGRAPGLPAGSRARPMTGTEFAAWREREHLSYAGVLREYRGLSAEQAGDLAARDLATCFPEGSPGRGQRLWVLEHEGVAVGTLWVTDRETDVYVMNVEVSEEHRGRGHGRSLLLWTESDGLAEGHRAAELNVHTRNTPALRLYESLGYRPFQHHFVKTLT